MGKRKTQEYIGWASKALIKFLQSIGINRDASADGMDISDECKELQKNVANGLLRKPTVVELEQKAQLLHDDIAKHWIERELVRLQNCIDRANEKGRRREYP
ncbi:hypothetical protein ACFX11_020262 [Malus domestica]